MRFLITGGCGFLGSNLAGEVLRRGEELAVFDSLSRLGTHSNLTWLGTLGSFKFVHGDIRNGDDIASLVESYRPEVIFHLAGQVAMTTSLARPSLDFETNALGSLNLLESARRFCPDATLIYSSTNKVYGDLEQYTYRETPTRFECEEFPDGFDESIALDFRSPYGCSKGAADQYFLDYARSFGLRTVVFRHSSMYGGRQFSTFDQGWIGWFCQQALRAKAGKRERFTISGNGKQVRDVLHCDDIKSLYFAAVSRIEKVRGQAFNIGGGRAQSLSLLELFRILEEMLGVELDFERLPPRLSDQKVFIADIGKAERLTGWKPAVEASVGIRQMLEWLSGLC